MSSSTQQINRLLYLITSSTNAAIAEYEKSGYGVPAPDMLTEHPLDTAPDALALKKALRVLEGACEMLCTTLAQPMHTLQNRAMPFDQKALKIAKEYKIADVLQEYPDGLHIDKLAEITKCSGKKLVHVMRLLVTRHVFREVSIDVFANNRLSISLISTKPTSDAVGLFLDECTQAVSALPEAMKNPEYGPSVLATKSSFMYSVRDELEGTFFDWQIKNPDIFKRFGRAMIGWSTLTGSMAVINNYPWQDFPAGSTFCDVGSGVGHVSIALHKAHPHLNITLQDLPGPLEQAKLLCAKEVESAVKSGKFAFVPVDFMKESPLPGQSVYYLKHIIHSWPDPISIKILSGISKVMPPDGRVLIHEFVTQSASDDAFQDKIGLERAPRPLLSNYGGGQFRTYSQDVLMMSIFNSFERQVSEFASLGEQSGLELVRVWDYAETVVLEYKLQGR